MMQKWCDEHPDNLNSTDNVKQRFVSEGIRTSSSNLSSELLSNLIPLRFVENVKPFLQQHLFLVVQLQPFRPVSGVTCKAVCRVIWGNPRGFRSRVTRTRSITGRTIATEQANSLPPPTVRRSILLRKSWSLSLSQDLFSSPLPPVAFQPVPQLLGPIFYSMQPLKKLPEAADAACSWLLKHNATRLIRSYCTCSLRTPIWDLIRPESVVWAAQIVAHRSEGHQLIRFCCHERGRSPLPVVWPCRLVDECCIQQHEFFIDELVTSSDGASDTCGSERSATEEAFTGTARN